MKRKVGAPIGSRTEGEIRSWLHARDAGSAPDRLRPRVARVTQEPAPPAIWTLLRPAAAFAGLAAIAALAVVAVTLRGPEGPAASALPTIGSASTGSPSSTASPYLLPLTPLGPWPRTGPVLAVPLDGTGLVAVMAVLLLAAGLVIAVLARRSRIDARRAVAEAGAPSRFWGSRTPRAWALRGLGIVLAAALIVAACGLFQLGQSVPLHYGAKESWDSGYLGSRSSTGQGPGEVYERFVPGGRIELGVDLSNQGDLPLTVTSFDLQRFLGQPAGAFIAAVELRLPSGPTMGYSGRIDQYTQPFHPFELPPNGFSSLWLVLQLKDCTSVIAGPTPGPSAWSNSRYLPSTGYATFGRLPFRYSVLGIERETDVPMNEAMSLVFGSSAVTC